MKSNNRLGYQRPYVDGLDDMGYMKNPEIRVLQTMLSLPTLDDAFENSFNTTLSDKITISTTVYDEFGNPLPGANIHIDGKPIASTYGDGTVTVPGIATSTSIIKITHVGMKDYSISAVFLPKKVMLQIEAIQLEGVVIPLKPKTTIPVPSTVVPLTPVVSKAGMSWIMWLLLLGGAYKGMQYFKDSKPKTVKAKI